MRWRYGLRHFNFWNENWLRDYRDDIGWIQVENYRRSGFWL